MDRRSYFKQLALATGGLCIAPQWLVGCQKKVKNFMGQYKLQPFNTLEEIQHFVRASSGHLPREMERVLKTKDAKAIFDFIQNSIVTLPAHPRSITSNAYNVRWGQKGMLRCGKGTLREKSDLLFFMLKKAGFNPSYHRANFPMTPKKVAQVFCKKWKNNNTVEVPLDYLNDWDAKLNPTQRTSTLKKIDISRKKSEELAKVIQQQLPEDIEKEIAHFDWLDVDGLEAPLVRISIDGKTKDINFVEAKDFEEFGTYSADLFSLSEKEMLLKKIRIILHITFSDAINSPVEICRGEWDFDQVVGTQIALQFVSPIPQEQLLETPIQSIQQFLPILSLQDSSLSSKKKKNNSFKGVGFDLMGNTFYQDSSGATRMNGLVLDEAKTENVSKIVHIEAQLLEYQYPKITIQCAPLDVDGKPVLGLSGNAFEITDQGYSQQPIIIKNTLTPKILILFDATASMPYPYAALEIPQDTLNAIWQAFEKEFYTVQIETKSYELQFLEVLRSIELKQYDHIICIGDGESFEQVIPKSLKGIVENNSISYHYINNGYSNQSSAIVKKCFETAGFPFFNTKNIADAVPKIIGLMKQKIIYPYVFTYEAPLEEDNLIHNVLVAIPKNKKVAPVSLQYIMNRDRVYETGRFPCGMSMTLEWDNGISTERISKHLSGYDIITDAEVLYKHNEAIRSFVLGTHRFFIEADKATLPILLDDLLTAQLSVAPFFEDRKNILTQQLKQINAFQVLPAAGLSIFAPLPAATDNWTTFENNFQTCLYSEYIHFETQELLKKVDIWPTSDVRTFAKSKKEAFAKTVEATSLLALSENGLFRKSTLTELEEKPLQLFTEGSIDFRKHPKHYPLYDKSYNNYLLYDKSFSNSSHWQINKKTGALLGVLSDGSGGGIEKSIIHNLKIIDSYAGAYNKAATPLMSDPLAFGTVTMYGQFLARLYGLVCVAVLSLDATQLPVKSRQAIKKVAYGVIKSFAFAKFGKLKNFEKIIDKLFDPGWPKIT